MLKKSLVSLALAGSLSASQFLNNVKDFVPQYSKQELNAQAKAIKSKKSKTLNSEQIKTIQESIEAMMFVNTTTFTDFLPTFEIALQKWVKEDVESVYLAIDLIDEFLNIRLKQYTNMKTMLKGTNFPKEEYAKIEEMEKLSREAKRTIQKYKQDIQILSSIQHDLKNISEVQIDDFWLPTLEENNNLIVKVKSIKEDDFDAIEKIESLLNEKINSKYIDTIMVA